ncbi:cystatin C (amyloid angiopathy and cerebral hemorrhage) [Osmerus mordax]|uniref:Cystatin n=1 Tax=Osmerus mordax TaxID=8014 RepID=C1BKN2_OSMMO|nr:Cystatin precursor [Osmerus mordax]
MNWTFVVPLLAVVFTVANAGIMTGGVSDADMNDKSTQDALQFAVVQHNKKTNDMYVSQVAKVIKVQKQVVAGIKYIFTVDMARTSCRKGGAETTCAIHEDPQVARPYQCKFEVWSRPWISDIRVVKNECE